MKSLTSVIFKNDKRREKSSRDGLSGTILSILSFVIVFGTLGMAMVFGSLYVTLKLRKMGQPMAFIGFMVLGNFGVLFAGSIFQVLNVLYFSKDLKVLLRMPIKSRSIIHAKLLKMIVSEYEMETIMLAIPMIIYGLMTHASFQFYLYIPIIIIILPVIPICITSIIVAIIMRFTNIIKNKSKVVYLTIIISIFLLNIVLIILGGHGSGVSLFDEKVILEKNSWAMIIGDSFKLIKPVMDSLINYNTIVGIESIAIYFGISVFTYIVTINFISLFYLKGAIGTIINSDRDLLSRNVELSIKDFEQKPYKSSYLLKEFLIIQRSPIFFIQCIVLPVIFALILLINVVIVLVISRGLGLDLVAKITERARKPWGTGFFISISQVLYMVNFTSIIAVSKEERWAVLSKYLPIKLSNQVTLKLLMGEVTNFISSLTVVLFYYVCTKQLIHTLIVLAITLIINLIGERVKILIDLRNPKIDWDNEYTMMKQNTNVMYELFYTLIVMGIIEVLGIVIANTYVYLLVMTVLAFIIYMKINKYIFDNDKKIFEKLY